jgi:hypothetical protein
MNTFPEQYAAVVRYSLSEPSHETLQNIFTALPFEATRASSDGTLHHHRAKLADALQDKGREEEGLLAADPSKHLLVHWEPDSGFSLSEHEIDGHPDRGHAAAYQNAGPAAGEYLNTALWSALYRAEADEDAEYDGDPLDAHFNLHHFTPNAVARARFDIARFRSSLSPEALAEYDSRSGNDRSDDAEHNLWLTRNGHGAGFWDGGWEHGEELTAKAKRLGEQDVMHEALAPDDPEDNPILSLHLEGGR